MKLTHAIREAHADLSKTSLKFVEFASRHPECLERSNYAELEKVGREIDYPLQAWPTFVRPAVMEEVGRASVALCGLVKSIPRRVFESDPAKIGDFYGLEANHARLVAPVLANDTWLKGLVARPDFIRSPSGFQFLECNMVGNLGGWELASWGDTFLQQPWVARFLAEEDISPRLLPVLRLTLSHLLKQALGRFRQKEINIIFGVPPSESLLATLVEMVQEEYRKILHRIGLEGTFIWSDMTNLEERDGLIYCQGRRVHAIVERFNRAADLAVYRSWIRGNVLLFNGPVTPVLTDKRNLAILWELRESGLFSDAEKEHIQDFLPPTFRISTELLHPRSEPLMPLQEILSRRENLVLKAGAGLGGQDIFLGDETSEEAWAEAVEQAFEAGDWVVQEKVESPAYLYQHGDSEGCPHHLIWGCFVLGETFGGCWTRVSPYDRGGVVNSAQGAQEGVVFEVDE